MPTAPKPRQVIALLVMRRNTVVQTTELIDELWEEDPPASAMTTLQTYVYKLRKVLLAHGPGEPLSTRPGGYLLHVPDSAVDVVHVEQAFREGQALLEAGALNEARTKLASALDLWRGPALADVPHGARLSSYATRLEELRTRTLELRIEADLRLGRHRDLISELKSLVVIHPLHEHLHGTLMLALHRSGRRHEALEVYRTLRRNMIEELGLEPGSDLKQVHQTLLADTPPAWLGKAPSEPSPAPAAPARAARQANGSVPRPPVPARPPQEQAAAPVASRPAAAQPAAKGGTLASPRALAPMQLPADIVDFCGRGPVVEELLACLTSGPNGSPRTAPRIAVVAGMPGVGKTTTAIHIGQSLREAFPDGQLFAALAGSTDAPRDPAEALHGFLRTLGVPEEAVPTQLEARATLFRSVTAGRRLLFLLDDVASANDVLSLLPGEPRCAVIVTSRVRLHGLPVVSTVDLGPLEPAECLELLAATAGPERVAQEPAAAARLAELGGHLPLTMRCIGSRLAAMPSLPLSRVADQLSRSRQPLDDFRLGELDLRSRYDACYQRLSRLERGVFRLLGTLPTAEFTAEAAADLFAWEVEEVERVLGKLVDEYLIDVAHSRSGDVRYMFPVIPRLYAREQLASTLTGDGAPRRPEQPGARGLFR
jgi:DNA-binding SARP family transcriptional activator